MMGLLPALLLLFAAGCAESKQSPCSEGFVRDDAGRCIELEADTTDADGMAESDSADPIDTGSPPDEEDPELAPLPGLTFDRAALSPPFQHRNAVWAGVSLLDFDDDGWLDIFMPNGLGGTDALYRNLGNGTFEDVAAAAGVDSMAENGASVAGDIDNDGDTDLVVVTVCSTGTYNEEGLRINDGDKLLYHNNGDGTFRQVALNVPEVEREEDSLLRVCTTSLTLVDWNQDGFLDLSMANHIDPDVLPPWVFGKTDPLAKNAILLNDGTGNFGAVKEERADDFNFYVSFVTAFFDLDQDGKPDMLQGQGGGNIEVVIQGEDAAVGDWDLGWSSSGRGLWMGLAVADYDGDGDLDVYGTNQGLSVYMAGYDNTKTEVDTVLPDPHVWHAMMLNDGESLRPADWPVEADHLLAGDLFDALSGGKEEWIGPTGLARYPWAWGAVALDANADGWMDVAFAGNNSSPPMTIIWDEEHGAGPGGLLLNTAGEGFQDVTWEWDVPNVDEQGRYQDGRGIATGDLNNDGYADLVIANRSYNSSQSDPLAQEVGTPQVLLSHPREGNWIQIDPVGTTSNRDGIGSLVRITNDERTHLYILGAGGETNSSSERLLTVGVGTADVVDIEVSFPSGIKSTRMGVSTNQRIIVEEGS
jgi:hypothetical protein